MTDIRKYMNIVEGVPHSTFKHTPGPWEVGMHGYLSGAGSEHVAQILKCNETNARLISAAPELLQMLVRLLNEHESLLQNSNKNADEDASVIDARAIITRLSS